MRYQRRQFQLFLDSGETLRGVWQSPGAETHLCDTCHCPSLVPRGSSRCAPFPSSEFLNMHVCSAQSLSSSFVTSWMVALQAPLSMEFFRQEYWSRWPFPTPGNLPNPGIKPMSPASPALTGRFFTTEPPGKLEFLQNPFKAGSCNTTLDRGYFDVE